MTKAILKLMDIEQIEGTVETGGDYARFHTVSSSVESQINGPHEGQLEIEGNSERVVVESCQAAGNGEGCEITLRRIKPEAR